MAELPDFTDGWQEFSFGEVTENFDAQRVPVKVSERKPGPYPYYGASGTVDHVEGYIFDGDYLLIAEDGANLLTRSLPVAFMASGKFWVNNHAHIVRGNGKADTRFLCYKLSAMDLSGYVTGSAQPKLSQGSMNAIRLMLPSPDEQRAIAGVLGALDDKIEQNRRTAVVLERLARAIFRAWFIDFEPVHAKAAGATAFPGVPQDLFDTLPTEFQDSELGPIPQGWEVKPATDVAKIAIGKTPPRKEPHWFSLDPADVRWVSIKDMGQAGAFISDTSEYLTEDAVEKCRVRRIPDRSVLFSFKLTLGRVTITDGEMTSNEAIAHFVPNAPDAIGTEYLYCYLSNFNHATLGSTSSIATATNSKAVKALPVVAAPDAMAEAFTEVIRPSFELLRQLGHESRKLAELRDYLLPKLLSGAVRVNTASAAEAMA